MKLKFKNYLLLPLLFLFGCSHTNELAKYDLNEKGMLFTERVTSNARRIEIVSEQEFNKKKDDSDNLLNIVANIGAGILSYDSQKRLADAVNTQTIVQYISEGLQDALKDYLNVVKVESFSENPQFHTETTLEVIKLVVGESGVKVNIQAKAKITDIATGAIVWDNWENKTIPISKNSTPNQKETSSTISNMFNAVQLAALSEEELNRAVGLAADDVGYYMVETLRDDILEARRK